MSTSEATSEGFDLDSMPASSGQGGNDGDEIIYELGGGATSISPPTSNTKSSGTGTNAQSGSSSSSPEKKSPSSSPSPTQTSEELKVKGNEQFKNGNYLDAIDYYTDAIESCPGMTGDEILELKQLHEDQEREKATQRYNRDANMRMEKARTKTDNASNAHDDNSNEDEDDDDLAPKEFEPPIHPHGKQLSIYYSNRAACLIQLQKYNDAIQDCDVATLVYPTYDKAYIRRMICYERTDRTEEALKDAKKALELNPNNSEIKNHVRRLQKLEDERMEKLKEETMGKLKDLGNSILGNFGMSLDNFKAQKDPNTGSYSISFQK